MYGYIYMTTNLVNGMRYIGKHKAESFTPSYKGSGKVLRRAMRVHGKENFSVELLEECDTLDSLNDREIYWITKYDAWKSRDFYNTHPGGDGGDISLYLTEEEMSKIRKDHSEYIISRLQEDEEFHKKFAGAKHGHRCYQTTKDKIGEAQKRYWDNVSNEVKHERLSRSAKTRCTGRVWVTNDLQDKFVNPKDVEVLLSAGYRLGRRFKHRNRPCKKRATTIESIANEKNISDEASRVHPK